MPANPDLNIDRTLDFSKQIMVERKANLDELSGNLTTSRARFEEELSIYRGVKYLIIENANYSDLVEGRYTTQYNKNSFLGSLHSFEHKYDMRIVFMPDTQYTAHYIYGVFVYFLKNMMR